MILRFLRRSSLNGDSWSIAISSRLQEDSSFLSHAKGKTAGGGSGGSRCASRAEAARPRRRDGTGREGGGNVGRRAKQSGGEMGWGTGVIYARARGLFLLSTGNRRRNRNGSPSVTVGGGEGEERKAAAAGTEERSPFLSPRPQVTS
jgi:hypothetical protein